MSFDVPFTTPQPDESWKCLKAGDRCQVKYEVPTFSGLIGKLLGFSEDDYTVAFNVDGKNTIMTYDGDMLKKVSQRDDYDHVYSSDKAPDPGYVEEVQGDGPFIL